MSSNTPKYIGDFMTGLPKASDTDLVTGNGTILRTATGMKELDVGKLTDVFSPAKTVVTLGGKQYSVVQIGDYYWMAENLKEAFGVYEPDESAGGYKYDISDAEKLVALSGAIDSFIEDTSKVPDGWQKIDMSAVDNLLTTYPYQSITEYGDLEALATGDWLGIAPTNESGLSIKKQLDVDVEEMLVSEAIWFLGKLTVNEADAYGLLVNYSGDFNGGMGTSMPGAAESPDGVLDMFQMFGHNGKVNVRLCCPVSSGWTPEDVPGKGGYVPTPTQPNQFLSSDGDWKSIVLSKETYVYNFPTFTITNGIEPSFSYTCPEDITPSTFTDLYYAYKGGKKIVGFMRTESTSGSYTVKGDTLLQLTSVTDGTVNYGIIFIFEYTIPGKGSFEIQIIFDGYPTVFRIGKVNLSILFEGWDSNSRLYYYEDKVPIGMIVRALYDYNYYAHEDRSGNTSTFMCLQADSNDTMKFLPLVEWGFVRNSDSQLLLALHFEGMVYDGRRFLRTVVASYNFVTEEWDSKCVNNLIMPQLPTTGTAVLKSVNGELKWVSET